MAGEKTHWQLLRRISPFLKKRHCFLLALSGLNNWSYPNYSEVIGGAAVVATAGNGRGNSGNGQGPFLILLSCWIHQLEPPDLGTACHMKQQKFLSFKTF
jgi:hypothetical protein